MGNDVTHFGDWSWGMDKLGAGKVEGMMVQWVIRRHLFMGPAPLTAHLGPWRRLVPLPTPI